MISSRFVAAALQMRSSDDVAANLASCREGAATAVQKGAALLVLPECFAFLGSREGDKLAIAEVLDPAHPGPILTALMEIATEHRIWLIAGGMPEILPSEAGTTTLTRTYNTCLVLAPDGTIAAAYRKIHLFDVDIPGGAVLRESASTAPGSQPTVVSTPLAPIGLSVCYDVRFPELYRELTVRMGATMLVVPAAFTAHTGAAHWHILLRARAIENQCYLIAAAQWGQHNDKRRSFGHTMIIDPWGTIVAELGEGVGVVVAEIDPEVVQLRRQQMPCLSHQILLGQQDPGSRG